jgi:branched-chain amino acid transport system permease protein
MRNRYFLIAVLVFVVVGPFILSLNTVAEMLIFGIIAVSTNILLGYTGMLSFGQAAYFGIGAYACGLLLKAGYPLILAIPGGALFSMLIAAVVGYFCVKRTGLYFICLTFAFNQMFYFIAYVWTDVTGGEDGLANIPRPEIITTPAAYYVFVAIMFGVCLLAMLKIVSSPLGLVFRLIRENPERAGAIGYNVSLYKWYSFMIASGFTALAGTIYAMLYDIVPIDQIHWLKSGDFIFMLLFGGAGNFFGPLIGAIGYIWLSDTFALVWARWPLLMGCMFLIIVLYLRGGVTDLIEKAYGFLTRARRGVEPGDSAT